MKSYDFFKIHLYSWQCAFLLHRSMNMLCLFRQYVKRVYVLVFLFFFVAVWLLSFPPLILNSRIGHCLVFTRTPFLFWVRNTLNSTFLKSLQSHRKYLCNLKERPRETSQTWTWSRFINEKTVLTFFFPNYLRLFKFGLKRSRHSLVIHLLHFNLTILIHKRTLCRNFHF